MFDDVIPADIFYDFEPPAFPVDALPIPFQAFVADQSELMGTDPALIGVAALAAAAACLDDRIQIQPKRFVTKYRESARLWVAPIGPPSTKKSPGISAALAPLKKINAEWLEEFAQKISSYPEVVEFYRMSGEVDYLLRVVGKDMAAYDRFYKRLISEVSLTDVSSSFAMEEIKYTTALPLEARSER